MRKISSCIFVAVFGIFGIIAIIGAFKQKEDNDKFFETAKIVDGVIENIESRRVTSGTGRKKKTRTEYDVYVTYTVDGMKYENVEISWYSSSMSEGDAIKLYYDPLNPRDVRDKEYEEGQFPTLIIVGSLFIIVSVVYIVITMTGGFAGKGLKKKGIKCQAEQYCIDKNYSVRVNGRHPYIVYCQVFDPRVNAMKEFKSKNCYEDLNKYDIRDIDVYLHPTNMKKYYVDVNGAIKNSKKVNRSYSV